MMKLDLNILLSIFVSIVVLCIIIFLVILAIAEINYQFKEPPPPNSTQQWKKILNDSHCEWYQLGCQKLACVMDCREINKYAGEIICVC